MQKMDGYLCLICGSGQLYFIASLSSPNDGPMATEKECDKALKKMEKKYGHFVYCRCCETAGFPTRTQERVILASDAPLVFN